MRRISLGLRFIALLLSSCSTAPERAHDSPSSLPNIVILYADDIGYGDLSCYGMTQTTTPHIDQLASEGLRFTNAYASSATCTPSRYAMLTGEYAFRQKGTGVLPGDAALIISAGRETLASTLARAGYRTGVVGKWHLGLGDGQQPIDWNDTIKPGPNQIGFDASFIMAATGDRVPSVYVRNGLVVGLDPADPIEVDYAKPFPGLPTGVSHRSTLKMDWSHGHNAAVIRDVGRIGYMRGGSAALWIDEDMADTFAHEAIQFIAAHQHEPFFLYFSAHDNHVPRLPHARFLSKSGMGPRGDALLEFDDSVGQIMAALERLGLSENTLVILTSDNGPVLDDGYRDNANELLGSHRPAGVLRGGKYSLFEGGTRVPLIVSWPARVAAGTSSAVISQVDFPATLSALCKQAWDARSGPDSQDQLAALLGESQEGRASVVLHAGRTAVRAGDWKYIPPGRARDGLGPWSRFDVVAPGLLFDLNTDPGETTDVAASHPERLAELQRLHSDLTTPTAR